MAAQRDNDVQPVRPSVVFSAGRYRHDHAPQPWIIDMLDADLKASDVFFDLLDEGQMLSQFRQTFVRIDSRPINRRRTGGDENRIELVVLGTTQM